MVKKNDKKILKQIVKAPKKLFQSSTKLVISPKSYNQFFKDVGPRANITIKAKKLKPGEKRKVI